MVYFRSGAYTIGVVSWAGGLTGFQATENAPPPLSRPFVRTPDARNATPKSAFAGLSHTFTFSGGGHKIPINIGGRYWTRTSGLLLVRQALQPTELTARVLALAFSCSKFPGSAFWTLDYISATKVAIGVLVRQKLSQTGHFRHRRVLDDGSRPALRSGRINLGIYRCFGAATRPRKASAPGHGSSLQGERGQG